MAKAATKVSVAVGQFLRQKRQELQLSLAEVSSRLGESGDPIPVSTLARVEQGKLDPGVLRLHQLLRLYKVPPHLVADLIEIEEHAIEAPSRGDVATLLKKGTAAWRKGDIATGLACLFAVRQYVPDDDSSRLLRQNATLDFAVCARSLGKVRLAKQILEDLLVEPPEPSVVVNALVLASSVWAGLGSDVAAAAYIHQAELLLAPKDRQRKAWVLHQKARVRLAAGDHQEGATVLKQAISAYRDARDTHGEGKALLTRTMIIEASGDTAKAITSARSAIEFSESHGHALLVGLGRIELGRLLLRSGQLKDAVQALQAGLGDVVRLGDPNSEFTARYYLWKAAVAMGDHQRARFEFEAAKYFTRFVDENSPEARDIQRLSREEPTRRDKRRGFKSASPAK